MEILLAKLLPYLGVAAGIIAALFGIYLKGKTTGYKDAKNETISKSLDEILRVENKNKKIREQDEKLRNTLPDSWPESGVIKLPKESSDNN
jgi:hypothetical protein